MHCRRSGTIRALSIAAATLLAGSLAAGCGADEPDDEAQSTETVAAPDGVELPDTPAGRQVAWFLEASAAPPIPDEDLTARMAPEFLAEVPPQLINDVLSAIGPLRAGELQSATENAIILDVSGAEGPLTLTLRVNQDGLIETLSLSPALVLPDSPESWEELTDRLGEVAVTTGFLAARVGDGGECEPVHEVRESDVLPIASMFKVYVLQAVQRAVDSGALTWDSTLTVTEDNRSWPTGLLQDEEAGTEVTVAEAAGLMIAFSDNTASDMLIESVGRDAVEAVIAETSGNADANRPFLTTQEMFKLRVVDYPALAEEFSGLDEQNRRTFVERTLGERELPELSAAEAWTSPRDIDTIGWFGSASDMCDAFGALYEEGDDNVAAAMSDNDGGIALGAEFPTVWYKGGSEPGVTVLGYLAEHDDGERYAVMLLSSDPDTEVPELDVSEAQITEMLSLVKGAFTLMTNP